MQRNIKVLVVEPNKLPYEKIIKNTLGAKQKEVDGYIEYTYMENCDDVSLICNDEGKLIGLPLNRFIGHDIIAGTFIVVGYDDSGEDRSLNENQIEKYKKIFDKQSIENTQFQILRILRQKGEKELC